jgi:hypothetical protein
MRLKHQTRLYFVDLLAETLPYTSYDIGESEYLGSFDGTLNEFIETVESCGYHYQLFAARKKKNNAKDDGSYARIPNKHPSAVEDTSLEGLDSQACQYHVHPFVTEDGIDVYGHYEIHPYPWKPTNDITRPIRHYKPTYGDTYLKGVVDDRLTDILEID